MKTDRLIIDSGCYGSGGRRDNDRRRRDSRPIPSRTDARQDPSTVKQVRGPTPYIEIKDEPAPKLIVAPHFPTCWIRASALARD